MSLTARAALRDATNKPTAAFNRDAAKSVLLKSVTSSSTTAKATGTKLLETLTNMSKVTADGKAKLGGARRVVVPGTPTAGNAPAAVAASTAAESSSWQAEKDALLSQIASLQGQLSEARPLPSAPSTWAAEKTELENACVATQEALETQRARNETMRSQMNALQAQFAAQTAELTAAREQIARLQREKEAYENAANADTDVSGRSSNSAQPSAMEEGLNDDTAAPAATETKSINPPASPVALNASATSVVSTGSPLPLPSAFAPFSPLPAAVAAIAAIAAPSATALSSIDPTTDDFAPITAEEMEASLGAHDPFAMEQHEEGAAGAVNESAASINLSLSASREMMSPNNRSVQSNQLPSAFCSPKNSTEMPSPIASNTPSDSSSSGAASSLPASFTTLSASARKIQAHFRGYLERSYLPQEQALAKLPLTSPSSATPSAKRRKRESGVVSPVKMKGEFGIEEEDESNTSKTSEAMNQSATMEEEDAAAGDNTKMDESMEDSPSSSAAASSAATNSCFTLTSSASARAALPLAQALQPADAKRFSSELRSLKPTLASLDACWTLRSKAMNRAETLIREKGLNGMSAWNGWKEELVGVQRIMTMQLSDLRSSILREACRLLLAIAEASPRDFEEHLACYFPILWKSLYVTIKIIRETADETCLELIDRVVTVKSIPLLLTGLQDTHCVVREKCGAYLAKVLAQITAAEAEPALAIMTAGVKTGLGDNDAKARASWRLVFASLRALFPSQLQVLFESLPGSVQKAIETERKTAAKPAAGAKATGKRKLQK